MPHWNEVFESIESYDSMTIEALQYSKIGKGASCPTSSRHGIIRRKKNWRVFTIVMKKIMGLTTIPLNDKYEFTKRAGKLMHQVMSFCCRCVHDWLI